jgi:hypothetical protein
MSRSVVCRPNERRSVPAACVGDTRIARNTEDTVALLFMLPLLLSSTPDPAAVLVFEVVGTE